MVGPRPKLTPAEYLAWEREQPEKHEYFNGEVFAMAGGSPRHNALSGRMIQTLNAALAGRCIALTSDQRIAIESGERYVYPDVSVVCGSVELQENTRDVIVNPQIVVEVISSSTEQHDRGLKWTGYQTIRSLTDYLLVWQSEARIEHFRRETAGRWSYRAFGPGEQVTLSNTAVIDVDAIFAGVFDLPGDPVPALVE